MSSVESNNDYLLDLLELQQDGKGAISAPSNWTSNEPLLEVETNIDAIVSNLSNKILERNRENRIARWHFFIGSPGNGKSAAIGKLCRQLLRDQSCRIQDGSKTSIEDLDEAAIPYEIYVFERDNKYHSARIVQDASVVRNPYSQDVDPASDLLHTLEDVWRRGTSLIVCTNRGVLERAHREKHTDHKINIKPWFRILDEIVSKESTPCNELKGVRCFKNKKESF